MAEPRGVPCAPPNLGQNRPKTLLAAPTKCFPPKHFVVNNRLYIYNVFSQTKSTMQLTEVAHATAPVWK